MGPQDALDKAYEKAENLVLYGDPDGDRVGLSVKEPPPRVIPEFPMTAYAAMLRGLCGAVLLGLVLVGPAAAQVAAPATGPASAEEQVLRGQRNQMAAGLLDAQAQAQGLMAKVQELTAEIDRMKKDGEKDKKPASSSPSASGSSRHE